MQYKMLNEVLEVAMALQINDAQKLKAALNEKQQHNELTPKQKRVLNCLCTIMRTQTKQNNTGCGTATVYPAGC